MEGWPQPVTSTSPKPRTLITSACSAIGPSQNIMRGSGGSTAIPGAMTRGAVVGCTSARSWDISTGT